MPNVTLSAPQNPTSNAIAIATSTRDASRRVAAFPLLLSGLIAAGLPSIAQGAVLEYLSYASWSGISGSTVLGTETFESYSGFHGGAYPGSAAGVSWIADSNPGIGFGTNSSLASNVMSTYSPSTSLEFTFNYPAGLSGVGGNLFVAYISFQTAPVALTVDVTLADSSVHTFSRVNPLATDFWGFHSTGALITGITLRSTSEFPSIDNLSFMVGGAAVPLPGAAGLAAAALVGLARRRRR